MKKLILFSLSLLTLNLSVYAGEFKVMKVYDGDTLKVSGHDIEFKVRLVGIDAPETSKGKRKQVQPYSQKSKKYLTEKLLNKIVDLKGYGYCPYNRPLCVLRINGININLELIKAGLAEVYRGKPPKDFNITPYKKAEKTAKKNKVGMWIQGGQYISPKVCRKQHKK